MPAWESDALIIDAVRSPIGKQGWNIGRMVPLVAGWPETVCGTTVDRQCGSSMQGNFNAAAAIWSGQLDLVVSAGVEMMSRVPMGSGGGDLSDGLLERWEIVPQGISAEVIADEWGLSREQLDAYSLESHRRALRAIDEGRFENEVVPVEVTNPHAGVVVAVDETPRRDTSAEALAALPPAFVPDGKVTAGNSSQIFDGAAAALIAGGGAAASRSDIRSAPPAHASPPRSSVSSSAAARATASRRCASASARR